MHSCRLEPAWQLQNRLAISGSVAHAVREPRRSTARVPGCNTACVCLLLCVLNLLCEVADLCRSQAHPEREHLSAVPVPGGAHVWPTVCLFRALCLSLLQLLAWMNRALAFTSTTWQELRACLRLLALRSPTWQELRACRDAGLTCLQGCPRGAAHLQGC